MSLSSWPDKNSTTFCFIWFTTNNADIRSFSLKTSIASLVSFPTTYEILWLSLSFKINTGRSRPARYLSTFKLLAKLGSKSGSTCLYVKLNLFEFLENSLSKSSVLFIDN